MKTANNGRSTQDDLSQRWAGEAAGRLVGHRDGFGKDRLSSIESVGACAVDQQILKLSVYVVEASGTVLRRLLTFTKSMTTDSRLERYTIIALMTDEVHGQ
ncbi:hypothetical protein, partial [Caballeronia sp. NCTM1]|uniref:hypothetical protein n=1 Tax=Caballeronia sp. NCTM1 TaxID=2921753 RepID=UPI0020276CB3